MDLMKKAKAVVVCANGVVAAWHPKKLFPYEHSLPIDMDKVDKERKRLYTPATEKYVQNRRLIRKGGL
uniref:Large ribosomal subunit protein mL42 n=1 Tax=Ditylenchus dipsaci TaxID=166011 RepID=A0A915DX82_9BILA